MTRSTAAITFVIAILGLIAGCTTTPEAECRRQGLSLCKGRCVDTATNANHCGSCNQGCTCGSCEQGACKEADSLASLAFDPYSSWDFIYVAADDTALYMNWYGRVVRVPRSGAGSVILADVPCAVTPGRWCSDFGIGLRDGVLYFAAKPGIYRHRLDNGSTEQVVAFPDNSAARSFGAPQLKLVNSELYWLAPNEGIWSATLATGAPKQRLAESTAWSFTVKNGALYWTDTVTLWKHDLQSQTSTEFAKFTDANGRGDVDPFSPLVATDLFLYVCRVPKGVYRVRLDDRHMDPVPGALGCGTRPSSRLTNPSFAVDKDSVYSLSWVQEFERPALFRYRFGAPAAERLAVCSAWGLALSDTTVYLIAANGSVFALAR